MAGSETAARRFGAFLARHEKKVLVGLLLALLLVAEAGLRLADPSIFHFVYASRQVHGYSPRWRVELVPERSRHLLLRGADGQALLSFVVTTNRDGLRIADRPIDDPLEPFRATAAGAAGLQRIHCIGDSFTMGWGVSYAASYPAILDWMLPTDVKVLNLGVDGFGTIAATEKSEALWPAFPAAHVVYLFVPGDFADDARLLPVRERSALVHGLYGLLDGVRRHSYFANVPFALRWHLRFAAQRTSREVAAEKRLHAAAAEGVTLRVEPEELPAVDGAQPSLQRLAAFQDFVRSRHSRLTVLVLGTASEALQTYAFCQQQGIEAHVLAFPPSMHLLREGHLNQLGNYALARFVAEQVLGP